jgi:hypothetical protein
MKWKLPGFVTCFGIFALAVVLACGRGSMAQTTNPSPTVFTGKTNSYKIEQGSGKLKDLEERLNEDGRSGWRILRVVAKGPCDGNGWRPFKNLPLCCWVTWTGS